MRVLSPRSFAGVGNKKARKQILSQSSSQPQKVEQELSTLSPHTAHTSIAINPPCSKSRGHVPRRSFEMSLLPATLAASLPWLSRLARKKKTIKGPKKRNCGAKDKGKKGALCHALCLPGTDRSGGSNKILTSRASYTQFNCRSRRHQNSDRYPFCFSCERRINVRSIKIESSLHDADRLMYDKTRLGYRPSSQLPPTHTTYSGLWCIGTLLLVLSQQQTNMDAVWTGRCA